MPVVGLGALKLCGAQHRGEIHGAPRVSPSQVDLVHHIRVSPSIKPKKTRVYGLTKGDYGASGVGRLHDASKLAPELLRRRIYKMAVSDQVCPPSAGQ